MLPVNPFPNRQLADPPVVVMMDPESAEWVRRLGPGGPEWAATALHEILLRVARAETLRRRSMLQISGPELDDLAHQAAADALMAILAKVDDFRGESRFTTWAYRFVILEVSAKIGRHFWRNPPVSLDADNWAVLPDRFGLSPADESESKALLTALRTAVETDLTPHQRQVFVDLVLNGVPLDVLAGQLGSSRNAIYKTMFDARRKLRATLAAAGFLDAGENS